MQDGCEIDGKKLSSLLPRMTVSFADTMTLTNSPLAEREVLNQTSWRLKLDLSPFTQVRCTANIQTVGTDNSDIHFEGSVDGTNWIDVTPEIALKPAGARDTDWQTLHQTLRADNILIRCREKDGDGALDPIIRQVLLMFK